MSKFTVELDINCSEVRKINWNCKNNAADEYHFIKSDDVTICEDFIFKHSIPFSKYEEIIKIPKRTRGYIDKTWYDNEYIFVDIHTTNGIRLQGIPYHLLEFTSNYKDEEEEIKDGYCS